MTKRSNSPIASALVSLPPDEHYMGQSAAGEFVGLSDRTLSRLRIAGNGPRYVRTGKKVMYSRASLLAWMASRSFANTSEEDVARVA